MRETIRKWENIKAGLEARAEKAAIYAGRTNQPNTACEKLERMVDVYDHCIREAKDAIGAPDRHYIIGGRIPDCENVAAHVVVTPDDGRTPWQVFVERHLYGGGRATPEEQGQYGEGELPEGMLPHDWTERDPTQLENIHGTWAYHNHTFEIPGPPVSEDSPPFD